MTQDSVNQRTLGSPVFVSYASQDVAGADAIVQTLERNGYECWIAPRNVTPGSQYADEIVGAINDANVVVLVLPQLAVASPHVGREIERAASKRRRIIALRMDAAPLTRAFEYFLSESQWIDVRALGMQAALKKLVTAVGQASAASPTAILGGGISAAGGFTAKRPFEADKRVIGTALVVIVAIGLGAAIHFWPSKHGDAQTPAVAAISEKSIAVLPFTDMSKKKDQEYFADGMADEILDVLAKAELPSSDSGVQSLGRGSLCRFLAPLLSEVSSNGQVDGNSGVAAERLTNSDDFSVRLDH